MNYIIERFDQIITALSSTDKKKPPIKKEDFDTIIREYGEEKERIQLHIMDEVFNSQDEKTLQLMIEKYQSVFIRLIDQLQPYQQANIRHQEYKLLSGALYNYLDELLYFLQIHYAKYFNHFQKLPFIKMEHIKTELQPKLETFIEAFQRIIVKEKLIQLIVQPLEKFVSSNTITYSESQYMKAITNELLSIDTTLTEDNIIVYVKRFLISVNFNSPDLTTYLINELDILITDEGSMQGKLRILKYQLKEINQVTVKPGHALYGNYGSLKDQIINWINEELYFYQTEQAALIAIPDFNINDTKIHTSLSVAKLALIIRLLVADKIIINRTVAPMLRIAAKTFTTLQKDDISFGSLETKYHAPDKSTTSMVRDMLFKWINIVNKL